MGRGIIIIILAVIISTLYLEVVMLILVRALLLPLSLLQILSFISDVINRPYTCQPVYLPLKRARQLGWLFEQVCEI